MQETPSSQVVPFVLLDGWTSVQDPPASQKVVDWVHWPVDDGPEQTEAELEQSPYPVPWALQVWVPEQRPVPQEMVEPGVHVLLTEMFSVTEEVRLSSPSVAVTVIVCVPFIAMVEFHK